MSESWSYQLVPAWRVPYYTNNGWEVAGQDPRYPSHCWIRKRRAE